MTPENQKWIRTFAAAFVAIAAFTLLTRTARSDDEHAAKVKLMPNSNLVVIAATSSPLSLKVADMMRPTPWSNQQTKSRANQIPVSPPPMGWSSWNSFSNTVDSNLIMRQTKALVASGMKKAPSRPSRVG